MSQIFDNKPQIGESGIFIGFGCNKKVSLQNKTNNIGMIN